MMRMRTIFILALLLVSACGRPSTQVRETERLVTPPATAAPPVTVEVERDNAATIARLEAAAQKIDQMNESVRLLTEKVDSYQADLAALQRLDGQVRDLRSAMDTQAGRISALDEKLGSQVTEVRGLILTLDGRVSAAQESFLEKTQAIEQQQADLISRQDTLSTDVSAARTEFRQEIARTRSMIEEQTRIMRQVYADNAVLFPAVEALGERKVGFLIKKPQLPEELLSAVRNRQITRPEISAEGIIIPSRP